MKAIIIGAGIGGLTTGIALQQAGISVEIYEREPELKAIGAGLTLWSNALYALDQIGLGDAIRELSVLAHAGGIHSMRGDDIMVTDLDTLQAKVGLPNIVVHRAELQAVLLRHFEGDIHYAKRIKCYQQQRDRVHVQFEDGSMAEGDILVACDGIHSVIRQQMFPNSKPIYSGYTAFRGVVDFDHKQVGAMWGESWGYGNRFGIAPLQQNQIYWFATANATNGDIVPVGLRQQTLLTMFKGWHHPVEDLIRQTPEDAILQNDIYEIAPLQSWRDGQVILLGDAAHAMTPNLGQGACQAIEDAVVLGKLFTQTTNIEYVLSQYQRERIQRANTILQRSQMIGKVGQIENRALCNLRNSAFKLMPRQLQLKSVIDVIRHQV